MLTVARRKAEDQLPVERRPVFVEGDARNFHVERQQPFDAAVMMFAVVGYLSDNASVVSALTNIRRHMKTGGLFLCDFWWGPAVLMQRPGERVRVVQTAQGQLLRATRTVLDTRANTADVHFDVFHLSENAPARHSEETHRMRYYFGPELELLFRSAGMELQTIGRFPQFELPPSPDCWDAVAIARAV
jgi:SAM-dependent methyltransferase